MLTNKDIEILQALLTKESPLSLTQLAKQFQVSERSIRYYIQNINYELGKHGITLRKSICYVADRDYVQTYLTKQVPTQYTSELRKMIVLFHLVLEGYVNITTLSKELGISRSSGKAYMEEIRQHIANYHLALRQEHKKGLLLIGSEENIRKLQLQTCMLYEKQSKTNQQILSPLLNAYHRDIPYPVIYEYLDLLQKDLAFVLSDYSYSLMVNACAIACKRILDQHPLSACDNEVFLVTCQEYDIIRKHSPLFVQSIGTFPRFEQLQLASLLIGSHYAKTTSLMENDWFEHDLLVSKIITLYSSYYQINLNQDRSLYESLLTHLRPTMYRMIHNIPVPDMDSQEIKIKFPREYETMKKVLQELNFFTSEAIDQDEIALLTLHFKAAINRNEKTQQQKKRVLIICSHGYGTSKLLEQQLTDTYEIDVIDCIPYHSLTQYEHLKDIDFMITTIHELTNFHDLPILHVSPLLNKDDMALLDHSLLVKRKHKVSMALLLDTIKQSCTLHDVSELKQDLTTILGDMLVRDDTKDKTLLDILPEENIVLHHPALDWREALQAAGNLLIHNDYVHERYGEQMLYSFENYGSYMIIDEGIAIPHAKNEGTVYKTGMTLVVLEKPVTFLNGKKLQVFFSFCSKDNIEHLDALVAVATLIRETDFKQYLHKFQEPKEVLTYISANINQTSTQ